MRSRTVSTLPFAVAFRVFERRHVRRRRRGRRPEQHFHDPLAAHHRRRAIGHRGQARGCCPGRAGRGGSRAVCTRRNCIARDVGDAIVPRDCVRSRTCSRRSADRARCDLRGRCCRRRARFLGPALRRACGRSMDREPRRAACRRRRSGGATAPRIASTAHRTAGRASIRLTCFASVPGAPIALVAVRRLVASVISSCPARAPQEERQARRELDVADPARCARPKRDR